MCYEAMKITAGDCVACGACVSVCPRGSIALKQDASGFYMPTVDASTCISCGKCAKVCPVNHRPKGRDWKEGTYYALWTRDGAQRKAGSSGGAFGLLAQAVLDRGGVVFGAAYGENCRSVYQTSTDQVPLSALKKSKYVESYTGKVFTQVKQALEEGRQVLYCGTSCQIDGLKNYLGADWDSLLTCDFLCHGVPSAGVFERYIRCLEQKYGPVVSIDHRPKSYGWKAYCAKVTFASGKVYLKTLYRDPYLRTFFENTALRESCFSCQRLSESNADITLGDFWRVGQVPEISDTNEGISLVGIHTEKGRQVVEALGELCCRYSLTTDSCAYAYNRSSHRPADREARLARLLNCKSLTDWPLSLKTRLLGTRYQLKAMVEKRKLRGKN